MANDQGVAFGVARPGAASKEALEVFGAGMIFHGGSPALLRRVGDFSLAIGYASGHRLQDRRRPRRPGRVRRAASPGGGNHRAVERLARGSIRELNERISSRAWYSWSATCWS